MKILFIVCSLLICFLPFPVGAEIKVIEAVGSYAMGDNDSKIDARRIAVQEAKRKALELAGTFVESLTEVKNMALTLDEIRAYTAGVVETEIISEETKGTAEHPEISVKTKCRIDTGVLMKHINRFRESEELKEQLNGAMQENEALKRERERLVGELSAEKDKSKAENIRKSLDTVLLKEESKEEINRVWRNLSFKTDITNAKRAVDKMDRKELDKASAVLNRGLKINPENQRAHMLLALINREKGDIRGAERALGAAIAANPSNPFPHVQLGLLLRENGRYGDALREFETVRRLRPDDPRVLFQMGMTHKADGNCRETVDYLKKFLINAGRNGRIPEKQKRDAAKALRECEGEPVKKFFKNYKH